MDQTRAAEAIGCDVSDILMVHRYGGADPLTVGRVMESLGTQTVLDHVGADDTIVHLVAGGVAVVYADGSVLERQRIETELIIDRGAQRVLGGGTAAPAEAGISMSDIEAYAKAVGVDPDDVARALRGGTTQRSN